MPNYPRHPKAPPRLPSRAKPIPHAVRIYAHIEGNFSVSCPACGDVVSIGTSRGRRGRVGIGDWRAGYDPLTAILTCRVCKRRWYVGILLWAIPRGGRRPEDHAPTVAEADRLRGEYGSHAKVRREDAPSIRGRVNRLCWCHTDECPVHGTVNRAETPQEDPQGGGDVSGEDASGDDDDDGVVGG